MDETMKTYKPSNRHDLRAALHNADAGDKIIYNTGTMLSPDHYAKRTMAQMQEDEIVNLVQATSQPPSKIHCRIFDYIGIRTKKPLSRRLTKQIEEALE